MYAGGATQITYYFSVHYLQSQSYSIDTGPLCICLPALSLNPHRPPRLLSSPLNTFGAGLPLWLKNTSVSMVPFFLRACPFGSALARGGFWLGETCAALMKICVSISSKGHSAPTTHSHSSFCSSHVQREITLAWQSHPLAVETFSDLILFVDQLELKCDRPGSPAVDGWVVIKGQGCW